MSINRLPHTAINKQKWDHAIENAQIKHVYAKSWFLDVVSPNWEALVLNDYEVVMPLPIQKKMGLPIIAQPMFCQQLGIFATKEVDSSTAQLFLKAMPNLLYIDYQFNSSNSKWIEGISRSNYELSLHHDYPTLQHHYNSNIKRNIKKSLVEGLKVKKHVPAKQIIHIFKQTKGKSLNLNHNYYVKLEQLIQECSRQKMIETVGAFKNDELYAGSIFLETAERSYFFFSSTSEQGRNNGALHFLIDNYIQEKAKQNRILDFEGTDNEGLAKLYKGFGAKNIVYKRLKKGFLSHLK